METTKCQATYKRIKTSRVNYPTNYSNSYELNSQAWTENMASSHHIVSLYGFGSFTQTKKIRTCLWGELKYGPSHSVNEENKAGYDSCGGTPIDTHSGGDTTIDLETVGPKYFICPTPGHCLSGMKLAVTVVAASSGTPGAPTPPSSTPATPSTPDSPPAAGTPATATPASGSTSPPPPPKASGASKGVMSYVLVGVSMMFGYGLWM